MTCGPRVSISPSVFVFFSFNILTSTPGRGLPTEPNLFAFNVLTSYADPDRMRPDLYYADPCFLFDYCQRRYSRWVAILHDYGLYEFTVVVRKEGVR